MNNENVKISAGYLLITILWGSTWVAIRIGLDDLTPVFAAGSRFVVASIFIFLIMRYRGIKLQTDGASLKLYALMSLFSFVFPFGLVYWGEQFISSGLTSVLFAVFPIQVSIFSRVYFPEEKIGVYKALGIILSFGGIIVIFSENLNFNVGSDLLPMILVVIASGMQAWNAVVIKKYGNHLNSLSMNFVPLISAGIIMVLFGYFFEARETLVFSASAVGSIFYLAFFGTVLTFTTYYWLMKRINVVLLALSAFITPILALIIGWIILDERLTTRNFIGSALVLIGILFANFRGLKLYLKEKYG
ncbi:MAG: EamA family transporter [Chlorobi bacterium]|nr:EamA family transporter [Chlorobiota bacterium]